MIRRTFLRLLGLAPALPLIAKLPAIAAPAPAPAWKFIEGDGYFGSSHGMIVFNPSGESDWAYRTWMLPPGEFRTPGIRGPVDGAWRIVGAGQRQTTLR